MKKLFVFLAVLAIVFSVAVAPAQAVWRDMWAYVYSWDGTLNADGRMNLTRLTSGVTFKVLQRNSDTAETLYVYRSDALTSLTNPVSTTNFASSTYCNDKVTFRVDPGETNDIYVDVIVVDTSGGYTAFIEDFTDRVHTIVIDERPNVQHTGCIWYAIPAVATETDSGIDFDYDTAIHKVYVHNVTGALAAAVLEVGLFSSETAGDVDGFIDEGVVGTVAGWIRPDKPTITAATTETYVSTASIVGALMGSSLAGSAVAGDEGSSYMWDHIIESANAVSLVYSCNTTVPSGYIFYDFTRIR